MEDCQVYRERAEDDQGDQKDLDLDVPRPFIRTAEPAPGKGGKEGPDDRNDRQVDQLFGQAVMAYQEPFDYLKRETNPPPMKAARVSMICRVLSFVRISLNVDFMPSSPLKVFPLVLHPLH